MLRLMTALTLVGVLLVLLGAGVWIRNLADDPGRWHVNPIGAERTGKPNDVTAGPPGSGADLTVPLQEESPEALMTRFDALALGTPRTRRIAMDEDGLGATYVTRSLLFGFPDYTSVRAVPSGTGASLVIWGRARIGHSDMGVNRKRVEGWLSDLAPGGT